MSFFDTLAQMLVILFAIVCGYAANRMGILGGKTDQAVCRLILTITLPAMTIAAVSGGWDDLLSPSVGIPEMLHTGVQLTKKIREGRQTPSLPVFCWAMSPAFSGRKPPSAGPGAAPGGDRPPGSGPAAGRRRRG